MSDVVKPTPLAVRATVPAPLDPAALDAASLAAVDEFLAAGTPVNTVKSYASAWRYWSAWLTARYALPLGERAVSVAIASQFVLDHAARPTKTGGWQHELPETIDAALVAAGAKAAPGPLALSTVRHRLAVLAAWHRLHGWPSPTDDHRVKTLLAKARRAQSAKGVAPRKKTAAIAEPLQAMLATCTDGLRGVRDRALLLLTWAGGGRRRSEVIGLQVGDLRRVDADTWVYALGATKTHAGPRREKPIKGEAAHAVQAWLTAAQLATGPLFRGLRRGGRVGAQALTGDHVARIVQRRARLANLAGDWGAHSLRSGFVTEAGRQGVPLGEVMALTEHAGVATVMGYFQAGTLLSSRATTLLEPTHRPPESADPSASPP